MLEETRTREQRLRDLPSRAGVYFVLALGLFPGLGYQNVRAKLTAALDGLELPCPSVKALRDLRRRIGAAPVKASPEHTYWYLHAAPELLAEAARRLGASPGEPR